MYKKESNILRYIIKSFLLIFFFYKKLFLIKFFILYLKSNIEFYKIEYYLKFCNNNNQKIIKLYKNIIPLISIISPIYNREKYIFRFINCIQNQKFYNIELIFIDDNSLDNSVKKIEIYKKDDKRIKIIKNKNNKGTLICRNLGILFSKGKYIILPDPDDIISKNILNICYKFAEKYNYEMIRFNEYMGNHYIAFNNLYENLDKKPIYQPNLKTYLYYGKGEFQRIDSFIHNKFIKKEVFIRSLNLLNNFYLNLYIIYAEDLLMIHILYIASNSFFFLKNIGYYYIRNSYSITNNPKNIIFKLKIRPYFIILKLFLEYYKNSKFERDLINEVIDIFRYDIDFNNIKKIFNVSFVKNFNDYNDFLIIYINIINKYLNSKYISNENKNIFYKLKKYLKKK